MKKLQKGFSLIEVLIFVSILGMFFVIAIAVTISSLRNMKINEHKLLATKYSEDLLEWFRSEKDKDFAAFSARASSGSGTTYCFDDLSISWNGATGGACAGYGSLNPAIYKREAVLKVESATTVSIAITTSWEEIGNTYRVPLNAVVNIYE